MASQQRSIRNYRWSPITKNESTLLRGLAILAIVFHNYLHWISDSPGENEFTFRPDRIDALLQALWNTPLDVIRLIATYFGHYGVQVFFFLSGYGIAMKYRDHLPNWLTFQKNRWRALFPAIIIAAAGYLLYDGIRLGFGFIFQTEGVNLLRQIIGISNFIPDNIYHPIGPWWFIGVILQFYLLAPLILKAIHRYGDKVLFALIGGGMLLEFFAGPLFDRSFNFNINHSILGHLDVCALGIWFARRDHFTIPTPVIVIAAFLFIAGNFNATVWISSGVTFLLAALPLFRLFTQGLNKHPLVHAPLLWIGQLSLFIFLCNGYLRHPLIDEAQHTPHWWTSIWTSASFLIVVLIWSSMLQQGERRIQKIIH